VTQRGEKGERIVDAYESHEKLCGFHPLWGVTRRGITDTTKSALWKKAKYILQKGGTAVITTKMGGYWELTISSTRNRGGGELWGGWGKALGTWLLKWDMRVRGKANYFGTVFVPPPYQFKKEDQIGGILQHGEE